ncbi:MULTISPECIES: TIGR01458 family HAD-type hydrolase [unclassified Fusibacter]|uniref:TIGR01458 family HAD-type hydrolase n=1 Tax=unclassified Fusibacter TaxID=2624464 RepID=UPI00101354B0|nr:MULTISPECIES: TIGR01458 family HAD-type hydrolase [unclassified Fusibacter]MCK8058950.1 TIGR01458 family HAD-type hydrolase [Fusibacter sp. A2]NPE22026.1 TIGR01458 family HAD-type hydrolase [Fusibacter sp. A1]RXV61591.1 TIGR01458 family HAD-type hydrolase [Fusibacter sp. A1]
MKFKNIDTLIFDLNGTLYEKGVMVKGVAELISNLREEGYHLNFITNTDGRSIGDVHKRVTRLGIDIQEDELFTPVSAVKQMIAMEPEKRYHFLVHDDVLADFEGAIRDDQTPDYVVIGDFNDKMNYDVINKAFRLIKNGAEIISLSNTLWYIDRDGDSINTGAFVSMFETACNKKAKLMGKPASEYFNMALARTNSLPEKTMVIGDDIATDIFGAKKINAIAIQVKTGVYSEASNENAVYKPDYIIDDVTHLRFLLRELS